MCACGLCPVLDWLEFKGEHLMVLGLSDVGLAVLSVTTASSRELGLVALAEKELFENNNNCHQDHCNA